MVQLRGDRQELKDFGRTVGGRRVAKHEGRRWRHVSQRKDGTRGVWFVEHRRVRQGKKGTEGGWEQQHEKVAGRDGETGDSEERMCGRRSRNRRRPTPRSIWDVNEHTGKVRR